MDNNNLFNIPGFYPTPDSLINKMLSSIDFKQIQSVLEPSAGSGNIVERVKSKFEYSRSYYNKDTRWDIDTIEINQNLQYILQGKNYRVVHDDFLTYQTYKKYDLIVMNPPFEVGDKHLLKAISIQESGGKIVCLLNAETLKNPYTNIRKDLLTKLDQYKAEIEYIQNAFIDSERPTGVEIALIHISIPKPENDSIILQDLKQREIYRIKNESSYNSDQIVSSDYIQGLVQQYNFEVQAGLKLIDEYNAMQPILIKTFDKEEQKYKDKPILELSLHYKDEDNNCSLANSYIKQVRAKYWWALFNNKEFMGLFTSNLKQKYINKINELKDYDFSAYNIYTIRIQLSNEMVKGVEETILKLFDEFSYQSSWSPEFGANIHYYSGWSTNKCWKINEKKCIIRLNGYGYWGDQIRYDYEVFNKLSDIEKVFNYLLTGTDIEINQIDLKETLNFAQSYEETKKIECMYFYCTFYKKGTCHLEWKYPELIHRFNIFAGQHKNNLPPSYGKKTYNEMTEEEQAVIREFEGELSYKRVMNNKQNYILETSKLLALA